MVAKIAVSKSIRRCFFYNENKVREGVASLIGVGNYPHGMDGLTEHSRLKMLEKQAALNDKTQVNSVHISLNFDPSEHFSADKLMRIANEYMEQLGFGQQPYLVYEHRDAAHPHIHIVTTNIETDGAAITLHRLVNRKSEPARKMLELKYGLIKAEDQKNKYQFQPAYVAKVSYGGSQSKRAIANVLSKVLKEYRFSSLAGLNAILGLYNVRADRGSEDSRIYKNNGLVYRILDDEGKPVGVPIKASCFYGKPTLKFLEEQYAGHKKASEKYKAGVKNTIDLCFMKGKGVSLEKLTLELRQKGIDTVLRKNEDGILYGITYVDHKNKCVFNGSDLGKQYSSNAIQQRCEASGTEPLQQNNEAIKTKQEVIEGTENGASKGGFSITEDSTQKPRTDVGGLLETLMRSENINEYLPYELRKTRKKRRKKTIRL